VANDYKSDKGKAPVMSAVFIPYRRTLLAIAAMMEDMQARHQLAGSKDPFQEWRQLPDGRDRLANAGARHALNPWEVNHRDGTHLHILHAIWGLMSAYELHVAQEERKRLGMEPVGACAKCGEPLHYAYPCRCMREVLQRPHGGHPDASDGVRGMYWTGDSGAWYCTCGAGSPDACTCPRVP
jgi:hypothetical protein